MDKAGQEHLSSLLFAKVDQTNPLVVGSRERVGFDG